MIKRTLQSGKTLEITLNNDGNLVVTVDGKPVSVFSRTIVHVSKAPKEFQSGLKAAGATHLLGGSVALMPGEASIIEAAIASHTAVIARHAEYARLRAAEKSSDARNAWQYDPRYGYAEGRVNPDRRDNTPSHKAD